MFVVGCFPVRTVAPAEFVPFHQNPLNPTSKIKITKRTRFEPPSSCSTACSAGVPACEFRRRPAAGPKKVPAYSNRCQGDAGAKLWTLNFCHPRNVLEALKQVQHINPRQGPRNVDLRNPPGPEGSNGSLLDICRGHPGISFNDEVRMKKAEKAALPTEKILVSSFCILHSCFT